jgi:glycosyltransferase involved in cell wall biosynthesis
VIRRTLLPYLEDVVIVDGGSKDKTDGVVLEYASVLPIKFHYNKFDGCGLQKNIGLEHCKGQWVLDLDADVTFTSNLGELLASGYFDSSEAWKFQIHFTVLDEFHIFDRPPEVAARLFRNGLRFVSKYHQALPENVRPVMCDKVVLYENSHLQTQEALARRGERWQKFNAQVATEGPSMGSPERYIEAEYWGRTHNKPVADRSLIVPRDTDSLIFLDLARAAEKSRAKGNPPNWVYGLGYMVQHGKTA